MLKFTRLISSSFLPFSLQKMYSSFSQNSANYRKGNDFLSDNLSVINLRRVYVWIDFRLKIINSIRFSIICWKVDTEQVYRISDPVRLSRAMAKMGWFPPSLTVEAKLRRPSTHKSFLAVDSLSEKSWRCKKERIWWTEIAMTS